MHVPVPWVFVLTYLVGVALERYVPISIGLHAAASISVGGTVVFGIGLAIAGWAQAIFWKARTTTVPGKTSVALVMSGPYRVTRNPMYVGLTTMYAGEAAILRQLWPLLILPLVIAYLNSTVIPVEEARLTETFRDDYARYRARVRRWF